MIPPPIAVLLLSGLVGSQPAETTPGVNADEGVGTALETAFKDHCQTLRPSTVTYEHLDGDSVLDAIVYGIGDGSGHKSSCQCIHFSTKEQVACATTDFTVYDSTVNHCLYTEGVGAGHKDAMRHLSPACEPYDSKLSRHASLRLLHSPPTSSQLSLEGQPWHAGPPQRQVSVCLRPVVGQGNEQIEADQVALEEGGHTGHCRRKSGDSSPEQVILYSPPGRDDGPFSDTAPPKLKRVASAPGVEAWVDGHSIALYCLNSDKHVWFVNLQNSNYFDAPAKIRRWRSIHRVEFTAGGALEVSTGVEPPGKTYRVQVPVDCGSS